MAAGRCAPELLLLLAVRRVVLVRPAMHRNGDAGLRGKPRGKRFAGMRGDHRQQGRDRMAGGEIEQALECGRRLDGVVVAQPEVGDAAGLLPAIELGVRAAARSGRQPCRPSPIAPRIDASRADATSKDRSSNTKRRAACDIDRRSGSSPSNRRDGVGEGGHVAGRRQDCRLAVADDAGHAVHVLRDDRQSRRLRLEIGEPIGFAIARPGVERAVAIDRRHVGRLPLAQPFEAGGIQPREFRHDLLPA